MEMTPEDCYWKLRYDALAMDLSRERSDELIEDALRVYQIIMDTAAVAGASVNDVCYAFQRAAFISINRRTGEE